MDFLEQVVLGEIRRLTKFASRYKALSEVTKAVYEGNADVVLVKNLARIGHEWGLVQEYIDFLNEHKVTLLCITEGLEISRHNPYPF